MACSFTILFSGDSSVLVATIREKIIAGQGQFEGDEHVGRFSLRAMGSTIQGNYGITGRELRINIEEKPFFVSCNMIKAYVTTNLTQ